MAAQAGQTEVAKRYAMAFLELADAVGALDDIAADLAALKVMLAESDDLQRMIANPLLSRENQGGAVLAVADKAGFHDLTRKFLGTLAQNRRLADLGAVIRAAQVEIAARKGEVTAEVIVAEVLSEAQAEAIKSALGGNVILDVKTDPDVLGGLIVRVGSKMIDNSVNTKLERLHRQLKRRTELQVTEQTNVKEVA